MKILLIEDNRADARLFEIVLRQIDTTGAYQLNWVNNLQDALSRLAGEADFDVILTDLGLPDSFGTDTLDKVCQGANGVPIIVLTGDEDQQLALDMVARGAADCLCKNLLDEELLRAGLARAV